MNIVIVNLILYGTIAAYVLDVLGIFFVLRQRTRLGYGLLALTALWGIIPALMMGSIPSAISATLSTAFFIALVAWFASKYALVKKSKQ
jgi:ABC-type Mn2+/Zn2+ transport system permease subunit